MHVAILGALDRHNYGDLLFPLILKKYLAELGNRIDVRCYALLKSNMSQYGGCDTARFADFYHQAQATADKNVIIVAGGAVIGAGAGNLYSFLKPTPVLNLLRYASKACFRSDLTDHIARKKLNITWGRYPFCPRKPSPNTLVLYNGVGDRLRPTAELMAALRSADLLSVRNRHLYEGLTQHLDGKDIVLCPDTAVVIANLWPQASLKDSITEPARDVLSEHPNGCIVFQGKLALMRHLDTITRQLQKLHAQTKLPLLLLPIGQALRHENHILLDHLQQRLDIPAAIMPSTNILDIMATIASARLFIGSSLHGAITAQSYAIPHVGLGHVPKLDLYLKQWDIGPNQTTGCIKPNAICTAALNVMQDQHTAPLPAHAQHLAKLAHENLSDITQRIKNHARA